MMMGADPSSSAAALGQRQTPSLADLLQQSRKLQTQLAARGQDLPSIHLGLDQIEAQSRKIAHARATPGITASSGGLDVQGGIGDASAYTGQGSFNDSKAHYFLANGGIDASGLADTITHSNIAQAFEPLQPIYDTDVDSYLRHSHEQVILSAIEEGRRETQADFQRGLARAQARDWELQKFKILEELGQHLSSNDSERMGTQSQLGLGGPSSALRNTRSMTPLRYESGTYGQGGGSSSMSSSGLANPRAAKYLAVVERLNAKRVDGIPVALASAFAEATQVPGAAASSGENPGHDLYECWRALSHIIGEGDTSEGQFKGIQIRERQYAPAYLETQHGPNDAWLGREGRELRRTIVTGAIAYLESQFSAHVDQRIAGNPVKAQLGGRPTTIGKTIAYERVNFTDREGRWSSELETIETSSHGRVPAWATVFYLLCAGNSAAALDFMAENEDAFRALDGIGGSFLVFFKAWLDSPERILPKGLRDRLVAEYSSRFRGSFANDTVDGYKQALFKLLGRIDVNKNFPTSVSKETETWMWLQLSSVRESQGEETGGAADSLRDRLTLQDLGSRVVKFGDQHFDPKGTRPLHYFLLLLLVGQFERAIAFLYTKPQHQIDAVNFAATLAYYGLLRVPPQNKASHIDILTVSVDEVSGQEITMVDFSRLIQKYVRLFPRSDAKSALQYAYLICLGSDCKTPTGEVQTAKCHDLIRSLILSTRQYFDLLGDVRNDGTKTPGLIEKALPLIRINDSKAFFSNIVGAAARQSEGENRTRDAILLYNIAEEYDRVLNVVNKQLGLTLVEVPSASGGTKNAGPTSDGSLADVEDMAQLARAILESYERQSHILRHVTASKRETCRILLSLKECFALFARGELEKALNSIDSLSLIPLRGDVVSITRKAEAFKDIDDNIARNLSDILLLVMNSISKLYQALKNSPYGDASRQQRLTELRAQARALMLFAGMLRLRIEPSTFGQLTRLDVYLH